MVITSLKFTAFCICSVLLFLLCPKKYRWITLLVSSIAFYLICAKELVLCILFTSLTIWGASVLLDSIKQAGAQKLKENSFTKEEQKSIRKEYQKKRKTVLILAIILNIGILVFFKVYNYFSDAFTSLFQMLSGKGSADIVTLLTPVGISYYTFSTVGYLLDVYWKRYEHERNFARFFLFAIYYPHIMQGPISRYPLLGQELKKPELYFTWDHFALAMQRILLGSFKKLVIADRAGIFVGKVLASDSLGGGLYFLALVLDAIQIYCDFSGYMDIVSGISILFDVKLEQNFNHPFLSRSVPEFWRRWHMSLGSWFKDYVYYPLSVSKAVKTISLKTQSWKSAHMKKIAAVILPVMLTWLLTGLWHGTGTGYILWGLYYGLLILLSVTFSDDIQQFAEKRKINRNSVPYRLFQSAKIFVIFMGGRFLSLVSGVGKGYILKQIFTHPSFSGLFDFGLKKKDFLLLGIGIVLMVALALIERKNDLLEWCRKKSPVLRVIVICVLIMIVFLFGIYGDTYDASNFIYQQF